MKKVTLRQIKREFDRAMTEPEGSDWFTKQRRLLDRELRRAGKVRSNFRDTKQKKSLMKLAALQGGKQ